MTKEKETNESIERSEETSLVVNNIENLNMMTKADVKTFTTIEDAKLIFNV